jgi:outer membrane lipoprotein-sorting protein
MIRKTASVFCLILLLAGFSVFAQTASPAADEKAEAILRKAIQNLGGERYLQVKSQIGRGKYSVIRDGAVISFQSFTDVIVYPDKERTEFKGGGVKTVQTNFGNSGWTFDGNNEIIKVQDEAQVANFKRGLRVSLDNLLRGYWRGDGVLTYAGRRQASLGKRNDVLKLSFGDGLVVEFEFADDGFPAKAIYKRTNADNEEIKEEDRYAQFVDIDGIRTPFIIDRFSNDKQSSRINYEAVEFNRSVPDSIFTKPSSAKELKKDLKI